MPETQHKSRILKTAEKQQIIYRGILIYITTDFSTQTLKAKRA